MKPHFEAEQLDLLDGHTERAGQQEGRNAGRVECQSARVPRQGECQSARVPECQSARVPECQSARVPELALWHSTVTWASLWRLASPWPAVPGSSGNKKLNACYNLPNQFAISGAR